MAFGLVIGFVALFASLMAVVCLRFKAWIELYDAIHASGIASSSGAITSHFVCLRAVLIGVPTASPAPLKGAVHRARPVMVFSLTLSFLSLLAVFIWVAL